MRPRPLHLALFVAASVVVATSVVAQQPACPAPKTFCEGEGGYYASFEDREALAASLDPILKELRTCLDSLGAKNLDPTVVIRFDSDGKAATTTVEAPGHESQLCVARVMAKLAKLTNPRETKVRCSFGCPKAAPPASTTAPVATIVADAGAPTNDAGSTTPAPLPPPIPPSTEEVERLRYRTSFRGQVGYELGLMYGVALHSARFRAGIGSQNDAGGRYFVLDGRYGQTSSGLTTWDFRIGGEIDAIKSGRGHFGLGAAGGVIGIVRESNGRTLIVPTIGMYGHGGVDLAQWGPRNDHALSLDLRLDAHVFFTGYYFGPGIVLGLKY